jgi:hypothetical protein
MTFHIPGFLVFLISVGLWWEYCWKPARAQWKLDQWRRHQAKYPPIPEGLYPYGPGWYEWLYKDDVAGLIAHKYRTEYMRKRMRDDRLDRWIAEAKRIPKLN